MRWSIAFRLRRYVRESLWVLPILAGFLAWFLGLAASDVGRLHDFPESWRYSPATAQAVLAAVVGASVALTGFVVTVSILIVQMATGTFSARYMRIFYRDRLFKAVLAILVATFIFSYSLLRHVSVRSVPSFGVTLAGLLLGTGLLLFVVFLDRSIHRLRPVAVAALVANAGRRALRQVLAEAARPDAPEIVPAPYEVPGEPTLVVRNLRGGAIQAINTRVLARWAQTHASLLVLRHPVGDFVPAGAGLIEVYGGDVQPGDEDKLRAVLALGVERTIEQDPSFAVRIMVDIAIRALSPAVNDPTTAVQVLDHLEDLLREVATTSLPSRGPRVGEAPAVGVVIPVRRWEDYLTLGVTEIREYGVGSVQVARRLRAMLDELRSLVEVERRPAVEEELGRLDRAVAEHWGDSVDLDLAGTADRQGIGGPSAPRPSSATPSSASWV